MSDFGTLRSDYYRRKVPYAGNSGIQYDEDQLQYVLERASRASEELKNAVNPLKNVPGLSTVAGLFDVPQDRKMAKNQLLEANPWLWQVLEELTDARLKMMTSDEDWAKDKSYGWKMDVRNRDMPESPYFEFATDPESGRAYVNDTDIALDLINSSPESYEQLRKEFEDYLTHPYIFSMTPSKRDPEGKDEWYQTTDDFLNALLATKFKERDRQALYDAAQYIWHNRLLGEQKKYKDQLVKENPDLYKDADAVKPADLQQFWDSPYAKFFDEKGVPKKMFVPPSVIASTLGDMVAPSMASVILDPELYYRTSPEELAARGVNDAVQLGLTSVLPWLGAVKGMRAMKRPLVGALTGGAVGGAADYGTKRIANEAFDRFTGHGTDNQPLNVGDLGVSMATGALTGPLVGSGRLNAQQKLRQQMNPMKPSSVLPEDVKANFKVQKLYGENPKTAEQRFKTYGKGGYDEYEKNYPSDTRLVQSGPKPEAEGLPLAMGLPYGKVEGFRVPGATELDERLFGKSKVYAKQGKHDLSNKLVDPTKTDVAPLADTDRSGKPLKSQIEYNKPIAWARGDDPEFVSKYMAENPDYWNTDFTLEDKAGLGAVLKEAQKKGSPWAEFFTGEPKIVSGKEFKKTQSSLSGNTVMDEKARGSDVLSRMWNVKSEPIPTPRKDTKLFGKTIREGGVDFKKQKKEFDTAKKTYARRSGQNMVPKKDYDEWKKGMYPVRRGLGLTLPVLNNAVPFGSVIMNVNPIEYEE